MSPVPTWLKPCAKQMLPFKARSSCQLQARPWQQNTMCYTNGSSLKAPRDHYLVVQPMGLGCSTARQRQYKGIGTLLLLLQHTWDADKACRCIAQPNSAARPVHTQDSGHINWCVLREHTKRTIPVKNDYPAIHPPLLHWNTTMTVHTSYSVTQALTHLNTDRLLSTWKGKSSCQAERLSI